MADTKNYSLTAEWVQIGSAGIRASISSPAYGAEYAFGDEMPAANIVGHNLSVRLQPLDLSDLQTKLWARCRTQSTIIVVSEF